MFNIKKSNFIYSITILLLATQVSVQNLTKCVVYMCVACCVCVCLLYARVSLLHNIILMCNTGKTVSFGN